MGAYRYRLWSITLPSVIRDIPDHATFREKGANTGLVRQARGFSLFDPL